jgi:acyl carrier protein
MNGGHSTEQIQTWLVARVAHYLECPAAAIDPDAPLADHGLDSMYMLTLCSDIEDTFDLLIEPPILLWNLDTLSALTPHIAGLTKSS